MLLSALEVRERFLRTDLKRDLACSAAYQSCVVVVIAAAAAALEAAAAVVPRRRVMAAGCLGSVMIFVCNDVFVVVVPNQITLQLQSIIGGNGDDGGKNGSVLFKGCRVNDLNWF